MDCRFLLVVTSPWESAIFVVITENRPLSYLGKFFHRLYILPCRYRYTIHEYWSSWHWCHIQEKKHRIRQCLEQQTYWLMRKKFKGINSGPNMWREEYPFPLKIYLAFSMSYQLKSLGCCCFKILFFFFCWARCALSNYSINFAAKQRTSNGLFLARPFKEFV